MDSGKTHSKLRVQAWVVFVFSFAATVWMWQTTKFLDEEIRRTSFRNQVSLIGTKIHEAVVGNEKALLACAGLFTSTDKVSRKTWRDYVKGLEIEKNFPGIEGIGFVRRVFSADVASHVRNIQAEGVANYAIRPEGERDEYAPVVYLEPFRDGSPRVLGYDMRSRQVLREAMDSACDLAQSSVSGVVDLLQDAPDKPPQKGFLIYHPIYLTDVSSATIDERRFALSGFAYCPIRFCDLLDPIIFQKSVLPGISVYDSEDGDSGSLVYSSLDNFKSEKLPASYTPTFEESVKTTVFGRDWTMKLFTMPSFDSAVGTAKPLHMLVLGLFASSFLGGMSLVMKSRERAFEAAKDLNSELQKMKVDLEIRVQERTADLQKTNRLLLMLSEWNKALTRAEYETQLLQDMTNLIVSIGGYQCCLLGYPENDAVQSIRMVAQRGFDEVSLRTVCVSWAENRNNGWPMKKALQTGKPVIVNDAKYQSVSEIWRNLCLELDIGSMVALPLISSGKTLGVFGILSTRAGSFNPNEMIILEEMAAELAFGIITIRSRLAHRQAEKELRLSEKNLKDAQALAQTGNWSMNTLTGELICSEEFCRIAGYDPFSPPTSFKQYLELFHPEDRQQVQVAVDTAIADGKPYELELELHCLDNTTRWVRSLGQTRHSFEKTLELAGTLQDITARKQMEDALRRSEKQYRLLINHLPAGVIVHAADSRILFCNSQAFQLLNLSPEKINIPGGAEYGMEFLREDKTPMPVADQPVFQVIASGLPLKDMIIGVSCPDGGKVLWMLVNAFPEFDDKKNLEKVVVVFSDITTLKLAEEELQAHREHLESLVAKRAGQLKDSEERYRVAIEKTGQIVYELDIPTWRTTNTGAIKEVTGFSEEEFGSLSFEEWLANIHPDDREDVYTQMMAVTNSLGGFTCEYRYLYKNDGFRYILSRGASFADSEGVVSRVIGTMADISERKRFEDALWLKNSELEEARKIADQGSQAKSEFVANVSHEIRTPLNAIINFANLALKTELNQKQSDYLKKIHISGLNLLTIINDILDFSKIEAGKLSIENIKFSINDVVNAIIVVIGPQAMAKNLNVIVNVPVEIPMQLIGDPLRLGQVLTNLMSNAVKFTEQGEIELSVSHRKLSESTLELRVSVSDTGMGIRPDELSKLFCPFIQADRSTTRKFGGTGLGLSISKRLVEMMGGEIHIESEAGKGTKVSFSAVFNTESKTGSEDVITPGIRNLDILVLETNPSTQDWFHNLLSRYPFNIDVVDSLDKAKAAVEAKVNAKPYDLLLVDCQEMSGEVLDFFQNLQQVLDSRNHLKTILVISPQEDSICEKAHKLGVSKFLLRPFTPSTVINTIVNLFSPQVRDAISFSSQDMENLDLQCLRILVVEDNVMNQEIARELLESAGIVVKVENNGLEAVEALMSDAESIPYDLILMDIQMPGIDGYETTRRIRRIPPYANTPIIAMTAHAMTEEREKVVSAGMNDHIAKPITPIDFFQTIRKWTKPCARVATAATAVVDHKKIHCSDFPSILGVNVQEGLNRLVGNAESYLKLLKEFPESQQENLTGICKAISEKDCTRARTLVHAMKGLAGNLSLIDLFHIAIDLEKALLGDDWIEINRLFEDFQSAFKQFSMAVEMLSYPLTANPDSSLDSTESADSVTKDMSLSQSLELLGKLKIMLLESNSNAGLILSELADGFACPAACQSDFAALAVAVDQFEFEQALQILTSIESRLK